MYAVKYERHLLGTQIGAGTQAGAGPARGTLSPAGLAVEQGRLRKKPPGMEKEIE
jgi:hypothetical protein